MAGTLRNRPRLNILNNDGQPHPAENTAAILVLVAGLVSFVLGLIVRNEHTGPAAQPGRGRDHEKGGDDGEVAGARAQTDDEVTVVEHEPNQPDGAAKGGQRERFRPSPCLRPGSVAQIAGGGWEQDQHDVDGRIQPDP